MATVVITFFLLTRFYVYKMDADCIDIQRDRVLSRREKRWSMNSQRLEEIVAELMKPISDVRRSFDTDLSAANLQIKDPKRQVYPRRRSLLLKTQFSIEESKLLEEYLTEAGLHALEAGEEEDSDDEPLAPAAPNFAELALLLQHSASVYGRKVDFLYQHVLSVSDSLQNSTQELERNTTEGEGEAEGAESGAARRRRRASAAGGFEPLELAAGAGALREPSAARPPPTLPRVYLELEPRQLAPGDRPLTDYDHEPVGLLADFHVAWRLHDGMLVDELEGWGAAASGALRPIPLMELQAAIEAAAPPPPPDLPRDTPPRDLPPLHASTPLPGDESPVPPDAPPEAPPDAPSDTPAKKERKRRQDFSTDDMVGGCYRIVLNEELRRKLRKLEEFRVEDAWIAGVVASRCGHIRRERRRLAALEANEDFRGFDACDVDVGGFAGWSSTEAAAAAETAATATPAAPADGESDDDGFFERSSLGDSDASRVDDTTLGAGGTGAGAEGWAAWRAGVVARAAAGEARGLDVAQLAARVLAALPAPQPPGPAPPAPCRRLLAAARDHADVPGLFLATLFLANAGNVEVIQGPPLSLNSFSVRLLSTDARLYSAAAQDDPHFLR